jgi:hypothetical protein
MILLWKLILCLIKHLAMKTYGGLEVGRISTNSQTPTLDRSERLASCPSRFTPGKRVRGVHWLGLVDLDMTAKRKSIPLPGFEQLVARSYTNWATPAPSFRCRYYFEKCVPGINVGGVSTVLQYGVLLRSVWRFAGREESWRSGGRIAHEKQQAGL